MARNFKVSGEAYRLSFSVGRELAQVHRLSDSGPTQYLGDVTSVVRPDGVVVWKSSASLLFKQTAEAAARYLIQRHAERTQSFFEAHVEALADNARRERRAAENEQRREQRAKVEAEEAHRRATTPMLSVIRHDHTGYNARVGDARKVVIHGGYDGADIYQNIDFATMERTFSVSWASHGSVSIQSAREYALAILRAADEAEALAVAYAAERTAEVAVRS